MGRTGRRPGNRAPFFVAGRGGFSSLAPIPDGITARFLRPPVSLFHALRPTGKPPVRWLAGLRRDRLRASDESEARAVGIPGMVLGFARSATHHLRADTCAWPGTGIGEAGGIRRDRRTAPPPPRCRQQHGRASLAARAMRGSRWTWHRRPAHRPAASSASPGPPGRRRPARRGWRRTRRAGRLDAGGELRHRFGVSAASASH